MNREQSFVLSNLYIEYHAIKLEQYNQLILSNGNRTFKWAYAKGRNIDNGKFIIQQSDSHESEGTIAIIAYGIDSVKIGKGEIFSTVNAVKNVQMAELANLVIIGFDVSSPITNLTLKYENNLIDDVNIAVEFVSKPKVVVDPRIKLLENLSTKYSTGDQLVNIYFKMANENVDHTIVDLFVCDAIAGTNTINIKNRQLMLQKTIEKGTFYTAIKDLAYGTYSFKIEQRDKESNIIVATDYFDFRIKKPNYDAKPVISNTNR